jgi:hypothetical protein
MAEIRDFTQRRLSRNADQRVMNVSFLRREQTFILSCRSVCPPQERADSFGRCGVPVHAEQWQWQWTISVFPASHRGIRDGGIAPDFQNARAAFERAWREIEPKITEADRMEHRRERVHTEWKYKVWERGCKLPTQVAEGGSQCYCGSAIDSKRRRPTH